MVSKLDHVLVAISIKVPDVSYSKIAQIMFLTIEKLSLKEPAKEFLKDAVLHSIHEEDKVEALRTLTEK